MIIKRSLIVLICFLIVCSCSVSKKTSAVKVTKSLLEGKIWKMELSSKIKDMNCTNEFRDDKIISTINYDGKKTRLITPYYLSDFIDIEFDSTKIGKTINGKYIVIKPTELGQKIWVHEIQKLDSINLILKNLKNSSVMIYKIKAK